MYMCIHVYVYVYAYLQNLAPKGIPKVHWQIQVKHVGSLAESISAMQPHGFLPSLTINHEALKRCNGARHCQASPVNLGGPRLSRPSPSAFRRGVLQSQTIVRKYRLPNGA